MAVVGARAATAVRRARRHRAGLRPGRPGLDGGLRRRVRHRRRRAPGRARTPAGVTVAVLACGRGPPLPDGQRRPLRPDRRDRAAGQRVAAGRRAAAAPVPDPQPGDRRRHPGHACWWRRRRAAARPRPCAGRSPSADRRWWCPARSPRPCPSAPTNCSASTRRPGWSPGSRTCWRRWGGSAPTWPRRPAAREQPRDRLDDEAALVLESLPRRGSRSPDAARRPGRRGRPDRIAQTVPAGGVGPGGPSGRRLRPRPATGPADRRPSPAGAPPPPD